MFRRFVGGVGGMKELRKRFVAGLYQVSGRYVGSTL